MPYRFDVQAGGSYDATDEDVDVVLAEPKPAEEPPVEVQGEPWGWTKPGPRPRGWRRDGKYGPD